MHDNEPIGRPHSEICEVVRIEKPGGIKHVHVEHWREPPLLRMVLFCDEEIPPVGTLCRVRFEWEDEGGCVWAKGRDGEWSTTCGVEFHAETPYLPSEHGMRFCCFCGKRITEQTSSQ